MILNREDVMRVYFIGGIISAWILWEVGYWLIGKTVDFEDSVKRHMGGGSKR